MSQSFGDFLRDPRFGIERIVNFNLLWLDCRQEFASFELLTYEQLHKDAQFAFKEAARFLSERELNEFELKRVIGRTTFDELHRLELSGDGRKKWGFRLSPGDHSDPESFKTRRGLVGAWREYFSAADCDYAEAILQHHDYFAKLAEAQSELSCETRFAAAA